jgi:hypothetical protein
MSISISISTLLLAGVVVVVAGLLLFLWRKD